MEQEEVTKLFDEISDSLDDIQHHLNRLADRKVITGILNRMLQKQLIAFEKSISHARG